ncbi:hypothetical protein K470DRAFT_214416 [Piedraia hortae CBS 480.64]|uniref:Uncharacterized protein n=1 Tax=Piedraia hortae CBS 480.64 TaxID=1314780 RepID=A0A6A7C2K1_9PEZI|nr:hypothetical protein K470DRAFT_214416 [Piedraia hortae CBS 480.64]
MSWKDAEAKASRSKSWSPPWRWRRRRLLGALATLGLLYWLAPTSQCLRAETQLPRQHGALQNLSPADVFLPAPENPQRTYNGPVKLPKLSSTLQPSPQEARWTQILDRNVLFAASSLQSVAHIMPLACEMASWDRNYVHMVFMGRDTLPVSDILAVNGVNKADCPVYFHDARSDHSEDSTDERTESAILGALRHVLLFIHPRAVIMDDAELEDATFSRVLRDFSKGYQQTLIELPANQYEAFMWITRLDAGSLSNWSKPDIDIIIQAPPNGAGGMIRLLRSLQDAEYAGLKAPRLTIELPADVNPTLQSYINGMNWPPYDGSRATLTLRHRISSSRPSPLQASIRFLESFYPSSYSDHHVLILSPQAELNPMYLHYLHYAVLGYKYSRDSDLHTDDIFGITLDVPSTLWNGEAAFPHPLVKEMQTEQYRSHNQSEAAPFVYQTPSATATLLFGDKWATLHNYLSNRLKSASKNELPKRPRLVPETQPAWLEYLLELTRARGWTSLFPARPFSAKHNDLDFVPEEYLSETSDPEDELTHSRSPKGRTKKTKKTKKKGDTSPDEPLHKYLPFSGDLPPLASLPYLLPTGERVDPMRFKAETEQYAETLRRDVGGCNSTDSLPGEREYLQTADLFCLDPNPLGKKTVVYFPNPLDT